MTAAVKSDRMLVQMTVAELDERISSAVARALAANQNSGTVYLTVEEAAKRLGVNYRTIINRAKAGEIKYRKVGRSWRIPVDEIERLSR